MGFGVCIRQNFVEFGEFGNFSGLVWKLVLLFGDFGLGFYCSG